MTTETRLPGFAWELGIHEQLPSTEIRARGSGCCVIASSYPRSEQQEDTYWPHDDDLERVPNADKSNDVEPAGRSPVDECSADARGEKVRDGEKHRGHAPLEPAAGANHVEQDVGGHEPAHEVAEVNADNPDDSKHDNGPLMVRQR